MPSRPTLLSIAGSDPSGGAGIQTDLKTFAALGAEGMAAIAMLTAQSPKVKWFNEAGVRAVHIPPSEFLTQQLDTIFGDTENFRVDAVKIGALGNADNVRAVSAAIKRWNPTANIVLDPVMVATAGGEPLLAKEAQKVLVEELIPLCTVWTPNLPEAAMLLDTIEAADQNEMREQSRRLSKLGAKAVLLKGGHLPTSESADFLIDSTGTVIEHFAAKRLKVDARSTQGTGCRLSSAIAVHLAKGFSLNESVREAKRYVEAQLLEAVNQQHNGAEHTDQIDLH